MPSLFVGPTGQYINTQGPSGSEMKAEAPKKKRTVIKLGTPYVAAEYIAKETARKREKALAGLRKVESETKARNTKRAEEAKEDEDLPETHWLQDILIKRYPDELSKMFSDNINLRSNQLEPFLAGQINFEGIRPKGMLAGNVNLTKSLGIEFSPNNKFHFFARTKTMPKPRSEIDKQFDDIAGRFALSKRPWYDSYQNAVEVALQLIEDQPELSRKEIEEGSGINQAKEDNSWSRDSVDDNKTHLEVENYIYDNWDKKADKIFEKREEEQVQEDIKKFKAKYGSQLPTTAAKALHIPKNMLLPALRVAGFNQKDAKQAYNKYSYSGTYGFRIYKTPKRLMISEEKSDFDKEMDVLEKRMEQELMASLSKKPETMARMIEILKDTPPIKKR